MTPGEAVWRSGAVTPGEAEWRCDTGGGGVAL